MRILALDLGRRMGVADGDAALLPAIRDHNISIEAVTVRGASAEKRVGYLGAWLHDRLGRHRYDLIITEAPMNPTASKSDHATIDQLGYYFCVQAIAAIYIVDVASAPVMAVRKHFCGQACAPTVRGRKRTPAEAVEARKFINEAVLTRAKLLGYLPADLRDWDQANACALWDFACAKFSRGRPESLVMFGERA